MKFITRQSLANTAANRWAVQYSHSMTLDRAQTLEDLRDLGPTPDPDSVDAIIGNSSWATTRCDECGAKNTPVVELGDDPDYPDTSSTICVCLSCLNSAIELITSIEEEHKIQIGSLYYITEGFKNRQGNQPLCKVIKANGDNTFNVEGYGIVGPGDEVLITGVPGNMLKIASNEE